MSENSDQHQYPHQTNDVVSHDDLASDFANNPDAYHPALHDHIKRHLGDKVLDEVTVEDRSKWSVTTWWDHFRLNPDEKMSNGQAEKFIRDGFSNLVLQFADQIENVDAENIIFHMCNVDTSIDTIEEFIRKLGPDKANVTKIFDELVGMTFAKQAIELGWKFGVKDFDQEKLTVAVGSGGYLSSAAVEFIVANGDINKLIKDFIKNGSFRSVITVLELAPASVVDSKAVLYSFINAGKAYILADHIDESSHLDINLQDLADAVVHEGKADRLLYNATLKPYINYQKLVEQLGPQNLSILDVLMEELIQKVDHTLIVNRIIQINDAWGYRIYAEYIKELSDANVDYDLLFQGLVSHREAMSHSVVELGLKKVDHLKLAELYSSKRHPEVIRSHLTGFLSGVNPQELVDLLVRNDTPIYLIGDIKRYHEDIQIDNSEMTGSIVTAYHYVAHALADQANLDRLGIPMEQVFKVFMNQSRANYYDCYNIFKSDFYSPDLDIDHRKLFNELGTTADGVAAILTNIDKVPVEYLNKELLLGTLEAYNRMELALKNATLFEGLIDYKMIARKMLITSSEWGLGEHKADILKYLTADEIIEIAVSGGSNTKMAVMYMLESLDDGVDIIPLIDSMDEESLARVSSYTYVDVIKRIGAMKLLDCMLERGYARALSSCLGHSMSGLSVEEKQTIHTRLEEAGMSYQILQYIDTFNQAKCDVNYEKLRDDMMAQDNYGILVDAVSYFPDGVIDHAKIVDEAIKQNRMSNILWSLGYLKLRSDQYGQIIDHCMKNEDFTLLLENSSYFPSGMLNFTVIRDELMAKGMWGAILGRRNDFPPDFLDIEMIMREIMKTRDNDMWACADIAEALPSVSGLDRQFAVELIHDLIKNNMDYALGRVQNSLGSFADFDRQNYVDICLEVGGIQAIPLEWDGGYKIDFDTLGKSERDIIYAEADHVVGLYMRQMLRVPSIKQSEVVREALRMFGVDATTASLRLLDGLVEGRRSIESDQLGITRTGSEGIAQFEGWVRNLSKEITTGNLSDSMMEMLDKSSILREEFMRVTRFKDAQFGQKDANALQRILETQLSLQQSGELVSMPEEYVQSPVYEVALLKSTAEKDPNIITKDVEERYGILRSEAIEAMNALHTKKGFTKIADELKSQVQVIIHDLQGRLGDEILNPKAEENIRQRIDDLITLITAPDPARPTQYPLRSFKNMEENFRSLSRHDELQPAMRKLVFAWALRQNADWQQKLRDTNEEPTIDDISTMRSFMDKMVNNSTFKDYFTNKKNASVFKRMTSVKALEEALARNQGRGIANETTKLQIQPTRGLLMEVSGHISDACWANQYESIGRAMPNMSTILFRQNPNTSSERLVGAAMLIETTEQGTGEPVLLLRGTNPLENYINRVSAESFYETVTTYVKDLAAARGMKPAIVIDDHSGGSGTNRPALQDYVDSIKSKLDKVKVRGEDTLFNGYIVTNKSFIIS